MGPGGRLHIGSRSLSLLRKIPKPKTPRPRPLSPYRADWASSLRALRKNTKTKIGKGKSASRWSIRRKRKSRSVGGTAAILVGPAAIQVKNSFRQTATKTRRGHLTDQHRRMPDTAERPRPVGRLIPAAWRQLTRTRDLFVARMPVRLESSTTQKKRWSIFIEVCVSFGCVSFGQA
jgi:hypothetical protein